MDNHNQVALVTGGARGIGRAISERLALDGYTVVINYVSNHEAAGQVLSQIENAGGQAWLAPADMLSKEQVQRVFQEIRERHGRLDVLVNNVGRTHEGLFAMTPVERFFEVLEANLKGTVLCSRAALRMMLVQNSGVIVNISSHAATHPGVGLSAYSAAKAALNSLTKGIACEVAHKGIRVNGVAPAWTDTDMLSSANQDSVSDGVRHLALGRKAKPAEVAAVVSALVRADMTYLLGQTIELDGGGRR